MKLTFAFILLINGILWTVWAMHEINIYKFFIALLYYSVCIFYVYKFEKELHK